MVLKIALYPGRSLNGSISTLVMVLLFLLGPQD